MANHVIYENNAETYTVALEGREYEGLYLNRNDNFDRSEAVHEHTKQTTNQGVQGRPWQEVF